ncbi:MAG: hypothetical protein AVDCRST_MAG73-3727 [uncultured Thermomicrobiales bacterium]|uniref:Uncharacterized protein n=1 Tax=uncultured Thermomicrobiales bacterium TaxID=1645740 RepID=A0A6J4UVQ7_9BACT|nr:MAG: hypothetical protein AVDCRST_MAG73-3727 [uncultured Thermomicrobiales bacterium]
MRGIWTTAHRHRVAETVFADRTYKDGTVTIVLDGERVTTPRGSAATRFLAKVEHADHCDAQRAMAKATGDVKNGNERR